MGSRTEHRCGACGADFVVDSGGGFMFDQLHCDTCGKVWSIGHREMGDLHLGFIKGLRRPYAIARAAGDARIQREWPGPVVSAEAYHAGVEAMAPSCECGGAFRYGAQPRCPTCGSTSEAWTDGRTIMHYD